MSIWKPGPGEVLLARVPLTFSTGAAMRVRGMRWFRDIERNDIQHELAGWPEGPVYAARSTGDTVARNTLKGAAMAVGVAILGVLTSQGGSTPGGPSEEGSDTSDDRGDEVEDFPVMWAAPGTVARTLPWQLDPGRSSAKRYRTHAVITDRRLVIVGFPYVKHNDRLIDDERLWEIPRSTIAEVVPRDFKDGQDVKIVFADGSWCRLSSIKRMRLIRHLDKDVQFIPLDTLTPAQRNTVERFAAAQPPDAQAPLVSQNACGCFRVHVVAPSTVHAFFGDSELSTVMDAQGTELPLTEYHPEDFPS
ncbi:hypothetical protein ACIREM_00465 [Streptomyces shenzhenensis]|uniref:hypothetical protein n=1 Tax=Streptomyces shenzhenensis TaxID=943815 RepID=UPI00380F86C4